MKIFLQTRSVNLICRPSSYPASAVLYVYCRNCILKTIIIQVSEGGGALNALRNFRLQKKKFAPGTFDSDNSSQETSQEANGPDVSEEVDSSPIKPAGGGKRILDDSSPQLSNSQPASQNGNGSSGSEPRQPHKRIRMLSDSESDCSPVKLNLPAAEEIERKVGVLQATYPQVDPMVIQDTLK